MPLTLAPPCFMAIDAPLPDGFDRSDTGVYSTGQTSGARIASTLRTREEWPDITSLIIVEGWQLAEAFSELPRLPNLEKLDLEFCDLDDSGVEALAIQDLSLRDFALAGSVRVSLAPLGDASWWTQLETLEVADTELGADEIRALLEEPEFRHLEELSMPALACTTAALAGAVAGNESLASLRELRWTGAGLDTEHLKMLEPMPHLRGLGIQVNDPQAAEALAASDLPELHSLNLSGDPGDAGLAAVLSAHRNLHDLVAHRVGAGRQATEAIGTCQEDLVELWLPMNPLGTDGARALAPALDDVEDLNLRYCELDAEAIAALVPHLKSVKSLDLDGNPLGPDGVRHLLAIPAENLELLRVASCNIGVEGAKLLADCPALTTLKELELDLGYRDQDLMPEGVRALAESPYLSETIRDRFRRFLEA